MIKHTKIRDSEEQLREIVSQSEVQDKLITDLQKWNQLCASMDVIGDTDTAIAAYQHLDQVEDIGTLYLIAYGLLQVLYVQQDAVRNAAEAVGIEYEFTPKLQEIRDIRNCAIGHPAKRGWKNPESFGIIRGSINHNGFSLYSFDWDAGTPKREVSLPHLIDLQVSEVCNALASIIKHLQDFNSCG